MAEDSQALRYARRLVVIITVAVLMFIAVQFALAFSPVDSTTVAGYQIDLVTYTLQTGESHWVYAITARPEATGTNALSHWVLGFDFTCYEEVAPSHELIVSTPTDLAQCSDGTYNCFSSEYDVEHGYDPVTEVYGVKWNYVAGEELAPGDEPMTHVFKLSLYGPDQDEGETTVAVKYGTSDEKGSLLGPKCAPSAVALASLNAGSGAAAPVVLTLLAITASATIGILVLQKTREE